MAMKGAEFVIGVALFFMVACGVVTTAFAVNITYDHRALVIDGKRRVLVAGSIHYPRSTPEMWPDLIKKSKDGGLDVIQTYVFWDLHEPVRQQFDFKGRKDLVRFLKLVAEAGLYAHLRIGPYVCAEWNYGGFPVWLHFVPGIQFRTDNEPFKSEMKRFTTKIVDLMKQEKLYATQGGPIILSQIENEYGNIDSAYGAAAKTYIDWAASMATSQKTGVPWVMCQQSDAPDPMINTCNGFYCDDFTPNSDKKPKMWTENWTGWFLPFGGAVPYRPAEDVAYAVARFYQRGGTFQNYYMYHGGTNFAHASGGPFIATTYDYDAPLDEYGLPNQPKWGHLKDLHKSIKLCEEAMVATDPTNSFLGTNLEAYVYKTESGLCAAFLANTNDQSDATVNFNGKWYNLPAWSVSILPDCKNVVFNTAKINSVATIPKFLSQSSKGESKAVWSDWIWVPEPIGISSRSAFKRVGLLEQVNTTNDRSDYLWYSLRTVMKGNEPFLQNGSQTVLRVDSLGHILHAFVNGKLAGSGYGNSDNPKVSVEVPITLTRGMNKIDLLSSTVGLKNYGAFFDLTPTGITGPVQLRGSNNESTVDLSSQPWIYQIGLKGEALRLHTGSSSHWQSKPALLKNQPLIWYKTNFDVPSGSKPIALDLSGMGKGEAWVNGQSIGRYWPKNIGSGNCTNSCNYRGSYSSTKCLKNCGKPSQTMYHVPRSWMKQSGNILVLLEEIGGDPTQISFAERDMGSVCSRVSQSHLPPVDMWPTDQTGGERKAGPTVSLECPHPNQTISSIKFASFGTPRGKCGGFRHGQCKSAKALSIVQNACVGSYNCHIEVSAKTFGDPCIGVRKSLAVEASCT